MKGFQQTSGWCRSSRWILLLLLPLLVHTFTTTTTSTPSLSLFGVRTTTKTPSTCPGRTNIMAKKRSSSLAFSPFSHRDDDNNKDDYSSFLSLLSRLPKKQRLSSTQIDAKNKKAAGDDDIMGDDEDGDADNDDDDWDPDEADLMSGLEDLDLDVEVDVEEDIEDDTVIVVADTDEDDAAVDEDDEDDDEDDLDLDVWAEDDDEEEEEYDEDEEIDEEFVGEAGEEWDNEDDDTEAYLGSEVDYEDEDYEEDEGYADVPIQDDPTDPNYMAQKELVEETVARREQLTREKNFDPIDFMMNKMTMDDAKMFESLPFMKEVEKISKNMEILEESDFEGLDLDEEMEKTPDLMYDDPYEDEGEEDILGTGVSDKDLKKLDEAYKMSHKTLNEEPWDKVMVKAETTDWDSLGEQTLQEMEDCLDEIGGSAYNCTKWLLYDLDFNVSNLILAAVKHNKEAPILFQHWYPQLMTYERYQHARDRNFDFNWDDVENADMDELKRYYLGFGYDEIPHKAPAETGIITFDDLDEEEMKMAAFENWMIEVYNPEWDRKDFDDDSFRDEDNVFSEFFEAPQHPDLPTFEDTQEDLREWEEDMGDDPSVREYRDYMGKDFQYEFEKDEEFDKEFRGHLVLACSPEDEDLEIAEKLTAKFGKEFGKQIYVETRVMANARKEDNVFEIWLESYDIDLLHSKRRASANTEGWDGPEECDDGEIDNLIEKVRFLISDDARYSYRFEMEYDV